jgi:hypothetical protein
VGERDKTLRLALAGFVRLSLAVCLLLPLPLKYGSG